MTGMAESLLRGFPPPKRILLIRLGAIGDIVMASGLVPALRTLWPSAHLAWLAEEGPHELVAHNPRLDRVHILPRKRWKQLSKQGKRWQAAKEMLAFRKALRAQAYDLVLDLQGLLKSGIWAFATGAEHRIGLGSREGSQWLMTQTFPRDEKDPRMGKEYRALATALGADPDSFSPDLAIPESALISAGHLLQKKGDHRRVALFAPFTTRPQKHWFEERWIELAKTLSQEYRCIVLGGATEIHSAQQMINAAQDTLENLAGKTSLIECAALIQRADLLIGVDTGLTHMAMATDTPAVALFGSTRPYWEPNHARAEILYTPEPCSPCHRHPSCKGLFPCMRHHTSVKILKVIDRITPA